MFNKDPALKFNIHNKHTPHAKVVGLVEPNSTVLDVGCNTGYVGEYLIDKKGCICDGIDCNEGFLKKAKALGYRNTFIIDLYTDTFSIKGKYDFILLSDVLEHLPNPHKILNKLVRENLKDTGRIVICLPNIARVEYRLKHLLGSFDYVPSGIMNSDHLRFFTRDSAIQMITQCSLFIQEVIPTGLGSILNIFPRFSLFNLCLFVQTVPKFFVRLRDKTEIKHCIPYKGRFIREVGDISKEHSGCPTLFEFYQLNALNLKGQGAGAIVGSRI